MLVNELKDLVSYSINLGALDKHMAETVVHDALLKFRDNPKFIKTSVYYLTKEKRREQLKIQARQHNYPVEEAHHYIQNQEDHRRFLDNITDKTYVISERERSQRQLISDLISDTDELTTAIVRTWLSSENPTLSSVGRALNINHNTVNRRLKKLAENFNGDKYGSIFDYFTA